MPFWPPAVTIRSRPLTGGSTLIKRADVGTFLLLLWLLPNVPAQVTQRKPVALVLAAQNASIVRNGRGTIDRAQPGAIIFAGDAIRSPHAPLLLADCAVSRLVDYSSVASVSFSHEGRQSTGVVSQKDTHLDVCKLPQLDPQGLATDFDDPSPDEKQDLSIENDLAGFKAPLERSANELWDLIKQRLDREPEDLVALVARAALLEQMKLTDRALALYRHIGSVFSGALWVKQPIQRLLLEKTIRASRNVNLPPGYVPPPLPPRKTFAFLIGISHYNNQDWVGDLEYADQDAKLFRDFLLSPRGGMLVPNESLMMLLNEDATQENIRQQLKKFVQGKGSGNNTLVLFIAAHGRYVCIDKGEHPSVKRACKIGDATEEPYILTFDSSPEEPKTLGLAMSEFRQIIIDNSEEFGRVVVYVDVCHSGRIGMLGLPTTSSVEHNLSGNGTGLLMATTVRTANEREKEFAYESPLFQHGLFTYYVVQELNGSGKLVPREDHDVHFQDLFTEVSYAVAHATKGQQLPTIPPKTPQNLPVIDDPGQHGIMHWNYADDKSGDVLLLRRGDKRKKTSWSAPSQSSRPLSRLEQAQKVIVTYVQGEQVPQKRTDFESAAFLFRQEWQHAPDRAFTESRMLFCEARALLFRAPGENSLPSAVLQRAQQLLERSIQIDPSRAYSYNALGLAFLEWQPPRYDDAIRAFEDANRFAPYWAYPLHNLALTHAQKGDYEDAIRMYREAMRVAPWASYPAYNLGLLLQSLNRVDEARQAFRQAIQVAGAPRKLDPRAPYRWDRISDGYNALGALEVNREHWRQAERYLNEAIKLDPGNPLALHNRALLDAGPHKHPQLAIQVWRDLLITDPQNLGFRTQLARTLALVRSTYEAVAEYERMLTDHPGLTSAWRELALIYVRSGEIERASTVIKRAELDAQNSELKRDAAEISTIRAGGKPIMHEYRSAWSEGRRHLRGR